MADLGSEIEKVRTVLSDTINAIAAEPLAIGRSIRFAALMSLLDSAAQQIQIKQKAAQ